jgi:hypothetical protein
VDETPNVKVLRATGAALVVGASVRPKREIGNVLDANGAVSTPAAAPLIEICSGIGVAAPERVPNNGPVELGAAAPNSDGPVEFGAVEAGAVPNKDGAVELGAVDEPNNEIPLELAVEGAAPKIDAALDFVAVSEGAEPKIDVAFDFVAVSEGAEPSNSDVPLELVAVTEGVQPLNSEDGAAGADPPNREGGAAGTVLVFNTPKEFGCAGAAWLGSANGEGNNA